MSQNSQRNGQPRESWIVDYTDQAGDRHIKTFRRWKDADAFELSTRVEVREGTHVPDSSAVTIHKAGELWLKSARAAKLEATTIDQYDQHLRLHIAPFIGAVKLSKLNAPTVRAFSL